MKVDSQFYDMEQEIKRWFVIRRTIKQQIEKTHLKGLKTNAQQHTKQSPQQTDSIKLNQQKVQQVKTFANYLPNTFQTFPLQVFKYCLSFLGNRIHTLEVKVKSIHQLGGVRQFKVAEMNRTSRKRLALCFSSKWRQAQKILYLIVHKFISSQNQIKKIRIQILNHRELILQTITNINQNNYFQEIARTILRHYHRLDSIVLFLPQHNVIDLDKLANFYKELQPYQILVLYSNSRKVQKNTSILDPHSWSHFDGENSIFLGIQNSKSMLVCYNNKLKSYKILQILGSLCGIIKKEAEVGRYLQNIDYFSSWFCQRQFCLRFYAYLFNFITLRGKEKMQPEDKQSLLSEIIDLQINSFEKIQKPESNDNLNSLAHTFITHQDPLTCLICKRRTKTRCQRCCLQFNKLFGLCEKQCFIHFHEQTSMYIQKLQKIKKVYRIRRENEESQQNELKYSEAMNGRKMRKPDEVNQRIDQDMGIQKMKTIEQIKESWKNCSTWNQTQYLKLQSYASARLVPFNMFKKVQYIRHKLTALMSANAQGPQIKIQQKIQNGTI